MIRSRHEIESTKVFPNSGDGTPAGYLVVGALDV